MFSCLVHDNIHHLAMVKPWLGHLPPNKVPFHPVAASFQAVADCESIDICQTLPDLPRVEARGQETLVVTVAMQIMLLGL